MLLISILEHKKTDARKLLHHFNFLLLTMEILLCCERFYVYHQFMIYPRAFYNRSALAVARDLIGARLVRILDGNKLVGLITETEAYISEKDLACHAKAGLTPRTAVLYGEPGHAYVYFTYGNHWMLNVVAEREGYPAAVLIRALQPLEGKDEISQRRSGRDTKGPGKLCQAMGITKAENGADLTEPKSGLWIEEGLNVPDSLILKGPRMGLNNTPEPWRSKPWRFLAKGHTIPSGH